MFQTQNLKYSIIPAFTLVELIVVIVILSILATISFLSFNSYSSNSRDSVRLGDSNNIKKGLELYQVKTAVYPIPEGTIYTGTINGVDVVYKGIIGDNISNIINVSKTPKDPIDTTKNYIYGITYDKTKYQIAITLENSNSTSYYSNGMYDGIENVGNNIIKNNYFSVILNSFQDPSILTHYGYGTKFSMTNELSLLQLDNALALSNNSNINNNSRQARVSGMYNGYIKFNSGTNIYLANIPSLIYNSTGSINLLSTGVYYVVNKNSNLPYTISNTDIYNNKSGDIIIQEYTNKTGATLTGVDITSIVNSTDSTTRTNLINSTFSGTILDSFGGNINTISSVVNGGVSSVSSGGGGGGTGDGASSSSPGLSCLYIKTNYPSSVDGTYWIKPDSNPAFQVYCDMGNGGWTLVLMGKGGNDVGINTVNDFNTITNYTGTNTFKFSDIKINAISKTAYKIQNIYNNKIRYTKGGCVMNFAAQPNGQCNEGYKDNNFTIIVSAGDNGGGTQRSGITFWRGTPDVRALWIYDNNPTVGWALGNEDLSASYCYSSTSGCDFKIWVK